MSRPDSLFVILRRRYRLLSEILRRGVVRALTSQGKELALRDRDLCLLNWLCGRFGSRDMEGRTRDLLLEPQPIYSKI